MKILIIGAGPVGTVYGRYLRLGGAQVSFLVREKYALACQNGFYFYDMNRTRKNRYVPILMKDFTILTQLNEVASENWTYVLLAMSSTALRGPWLPQLISTIRSARLITLQPGLEDREYILQFCTPSQLIEGSIPTVSYSAPLTGETVPTPGIAYWLPPGAQGLFSGDAAAVDSLIHTLQHGGFPAHSCADTRLEILFPSVLLTTLIAALQSSGWSFQNLTSGPHLSLACKAISEAFALVSHHFNAQPPKSLIYFIKPFTIRTLLFLSQWIVPFHFETMLKTHFTKVEDQMKQMLKDYIALSRKYSMPAPALEQLGDLYR